MLSLNNQALYHIEGILRCLGYTKDEDPLKPRSILAEEEKTVNKLLAGNNSEDIKTTKKLNKVIDSMDMETDSGINSAIKKTDKIITNHGKKVAVGSAVILAIDSDAYYKTIKGAVAESVSIPYDFIDADQRTIDAINKWQQTFIGDNYKNNVTKEVENIIRNTIKANDGTLSRTQIARQLKKQMPDVVVQKGYWNTVASAVLNNSRSGASLNVFKQAGIQRYTVLAVLDERTSDVCQNMHGRTFEVKVGLKAFENLENAETADEAKEASPWMSSDSKGNVLLNGEKVGTLSNSELEARGISTPPYHGKCRTTIIAEF